MKARYALVRVDKLQHCPLYEGITGFCRKSGCDDCNMRENYGDTKEQLIRKVAQAIRIISRELNRSNITMTEEQIFKTTVQFIVEFLGVEE